MCDLKDCQLFDIRLINNSCLNKMLCLLSFGIHILSWDQFCNCIICNLDSEIQFGILYYVLEFTIISCNPKNRSYTCCSEERCEKGRECFGKNEPNLILLVSNPIHIFIQSNQFYPISQPLPPLPIETIKQILD